LSQAANLPEVFVRPDLGPRSYISYGDSQSPDCGTYNLSLELADTLWIVVRAETPSDLDKPEYRNQVNISVWPSCQCSTLSSVYLPFFTSCKVTGLFILTMTQRLVC
jgi:hypothetical protein